MLAVLSPAKTLDFEHPLPGHPETTRPRLLDHAEQLVEALRRYPPEGLEKLMGVSPKLAALNMERYAHWQRPFHNDNARPAMLAFRGDVYQGLDAKSLDATSLAFAQDHLRILSGLYGVLRPLDLMQAYRLEMGTPLPVEGADNLYQFWENEITDLLQQDLRHQTAEEATLVNLASQEYFKAVRPDRLDARILQIDFKELRDGKPRTIAVYAKKARGMMARFIIEEQITQSDDLQAFDRGGYYFAPEHSRDHHWVFVR